MTTKQYLSQVERLDRMIQNKLSEIYQLKTMACSVTVTNNEDKVQTSSDKDKLGSAVAKIVDLERETDELVDSYVEKRNIIIKQIDSMDNIDYYHVLSMRYVGKNTFENIAKNTGWGIRQVFRIHDKAINEFEKLYGNEYIEK